MIKKIFFIGITLSVLAGCNKDFLDTKPHSAISSANIWANDKNATMGINGMYSYLRLEHGFGNFTFRFSIWGPDAIHYNGGGSIPAGSSDAGSGDIERRYKWPYQIIGRANDAIGNLTDNPNVTPELRDRFIAEAKFIRGFCYFHLWTLYGGVIILDKPTPISESYLPRNTADEVKEFMIKDFTDAVAGLPVVYPSADDLGRATKGAAQAMLGKIYLYDKQWTKAVEELGKLMTAPYTYALWPKYAELFDFKTERNTEVIFGVEDISEPGLGSENDVRYGGRSLNGSGWSETCASWATINAYTNTDGSAIDKSDMPRLSDFGGDDYQLGLALIPWYQERFKNADKRLLDNVILPGYTIKGVNNIEFMMKWPYGEHANDDPYPAYQLDDASKAGIPWRKYINVGMESTVRWDSPTNIVLIRFADILLLWAEAKNEAEGPSQEIYDVINAIRDRGQVPHISGLSQEDLRTAIRMERFRELPGEGQLFFDVRRWRTASGTDPIFGLNKEENDFRMERLWTRKFTEKFYLWAIPYDEILMNPKLTQNPGWEQ